MRIRKVMTPHAVNFLLFFIGIVGVGLTAESVIAVLFAIIASLHFEIEVRDE